MNRGLASMRPCSSYNMFDVVVSYSSSSFNVIPVLRSIKPQNEAVWCCFDEFLIGSAIKIFFVDIHIDIFLNAVVIVVKTKILELYTHLDDRWRLVN